jgi:hypothetical protein
MGFFRAIGPDTSKEDVIRTARAEGWLKVERCRIHQYFLMFPSNSTPSSFMLHLNPKNEIDLPPLPPNKAAEQVVGDFLRYIYQYTKKYIQETHDGGVQLWDRLNGHIEFVLPYPNGWEVTQKTTMGKAAVVAGLVPDTPAGRSRVHLLTQGEATLNYCAWDNYASGQIKVSKLPVVPLLS